MKNRVRLEYLILLWLKSHVSILQKFDLIVIGGGTGLEIANAAVHQGFKVAIIEKNRLGGTCLNRGCIPSKLLIHSADILQTIKSSKLFGINTRDLSVDFKKIINRVNKITDDESNKIKEGLLQSNNPLLYEEECHFVGKKEIAFKKQGKEGINKDYGNNKNTRYNTDENILADKILIATGTIPRIPKIKGLAESGYITSDEALHLKEQPRSITFIGGGYIACELAHFFGSLGTKVNIIQRNDFLIPNDDEEIREKFTEIFSKKYQICLGHNVESVSKINDRDGFKIFQVMATKDDGTIIRVDSDQLIVSTGREPNSSILKLEKTGVQVNDQGFIKVDEYLETTMAGIFAIGDVVGRYQFKHNANLEARYVYSNIFLHNQEKKTPVDYTAMPHAIFSSPQVAGVGYTEQELREKNIQYLKSVYPYFETGMGLAIDDKEGFVKFLVNKKNRKILGCHILGTAASTLIHEVLVTMRSGNGTIESISNTIHIHPALSEVVGKAAENI